ncbi:MAG: hypothetical protein AABX66_00985 [Nanoarchaeota archaeon]
MARTKKTTILKRVKIREIKSKLKVKDLKDNSEEFDDEFEEEPVFVQERHTPRRLTSKLKVQPRSLEEIPEIETAPVTTNQNREEIKYSSTSKGTETRIRYESLSGGKLENYQGVGKDKYHHTNAVNAEEKIREEQKDNRAYSERNPFNDSSERHYQPNAFDNGLNSKDKEKSEKEKKRVMM